VAADPLLNQPATKLSRNQAKFRLMYCLAEQYFESSSY
jgi:hypothetical protein